MISESYYWKRELVKFSGEFSAWSQRYASKADDGASSDEAIFHLERSIYYPAFIIRKLIECRKVTDRLRDQKIELQVFRSKQTGPTKLIHLYGSDDLTSNYNMENPEFQNFDVWQLASEILHSLTIVFYLSKAVDRIEGIFVASRRNNWNRLVELPAQTWLEILRQFSADDIVDAHLHFAASGKIEAMLK